MSISTFQKIRSFSKKFKRHKYTCASCAVCLAVPVVLGGCGTGGADENVRFQEYTEALFCSEVSSSAVSLHYTLKEPEKYGISSAPASFGSFSTDPAPLRAASENMQQALLQFS